MAGGRDPVAAARQALADGRPWVARDRLAGVLGHRPDDQEVLALLGDAWSALQDQARAGRYWFLTARSGPEVEQAVTAWANQQPSAVQRARELNVRSQPERHYPAPALERMTGLAQEVQREGASWSPGSSVKVPGGRLPSRRASLPTRVVGSLLIAVLLLATVGVWAFGLLSLLRAIL